MNGTTLVFRCRFIAKLAFCLCLWIFSQQVLAQKNTDEKTTPVVMAKVGNFEITEQALVRWLRKSFPNFANESSELTKPTLASYGSPLVKGALDHLVNRRLVLEYLRANRLEAATPAEIKLDLEKLSVELEQIDKTVDDFLKEEEISKKDLESEVEWEIAWERYLSKVLSDEYLKKHFDRHRRRFDHSEMRIAHLLIKTDVLSAADAMKLAERIFEEIEASPPDERDQIWKTAVGQHSQAPSKDSGGEMGWIRYHEPMPEEFSARAFSLKAGEVSRPVRMAFGIHLIRCLEMREGKMGWRDAKTAVRDHAAKTLFERIAQKQRPKVVITFR